MIYFSHFLLPTLAGLTIVYFYYYFRYFKNHQFKGNGDNLPKNPFYSEQEILSSSQNYIPLHLSNELPDYSTYRKGKKTKEGINYFLKIFNGDVLENTRFILLGSAGIGKTTFLLNLYKTASLCLPDNIDIQLFPLRTCCLESDIRSLNHPENQTILLLDGLDELPIDSNLSLNEIIKMTEGFKYVIITSRIESFKENDSEFSTNIIKYSGNKEHYKIKKFYLSPFAKEEINKYLKYVFKDDNKLDQFISILFGNDNVNKAQSLLDKVKFASLKPLFLYYITDIVRDGTSYFSSDSEIYESLIYKWLIRESYNIEDKENFMEGMNKVLEKIALSMKESKIQYLTEDEIEKISSEIHGNLNNLFSKSKSLLVKNEKGHFYFFHSSILEYFLAKNKFQEIKETTLFENMKINANVSLYTHFINEMGLECLFASNGIKAFFGEYRASYSLTLSHLMHLRLKMENIDSWKSLLIIKSLDIHSCDFSLCILSLFPNIQKLTYKGMNEEELKYLVYLKKIKILDISQNKKIKSLSFLKNIPSLKELVLNDSNVDLSTLLPLNDSINKIIISKNQYTEEVDKFPSSIIKYKKLDL